MPSVLSYTNAFPGAPYPNHLAGQSHPQNYLYPGAVQPGGTTSVLSYANAFPNAAFPQHLASQTTTVFDKLYSGATQPLLIPATGASRRSPLWVIRRSQWHPARFLQQKRRAPPLIIIVPPPVAPVVPPVEDGGGGGMPARFYHYDPPPLRIFRFSGELPRLSGSAFGGALDLSDLLDADWVGKLAAQIDELRLIKGAVAGEIGLLHGAAVGFPTRVGKIVGSLAIPMGAIDGYQLFIANGAGELPALSGNMIWKASILHDDEEFILIIAASQ